MSEETKTIPTETVEKKEEVKVETEKKEDEGLKTHLLEEK